MKTVCKLLGFLLLPGAFAASCSGDSSLPSSGDSAVEVRLQSRVPSAGPLSRAPYDASGSASPLSALVLKSVAAGDYVSKGVYRETLSFTGSSPVGFSVPQYFPTDDSPLYLCALYPSDGLWENEVYSDVTRSTTVTRVLDGRTDLMVSAGQGMSKSEFNKNKVITLKFAHLLTKLKVRMVADAAAAFPVEDVWGKVTGLELTKVLGSAPATQALVNLNAGSATFTEGGSALPFPFYCMAGDDAYPAEDLLFMDRELPVPATVSDVAYSLAAPFVPTGRDDLVLTVYTSLFPQGVPVSVGLASADVDSASGTAGQYCVVTLTFTTGDKPLIQCKAEITDWQQGSSMDNVLE